MDIVKSLSHVWLPVTPWTVDCQALLSMKFFRQEYWSGLPFPTPVDLPNPRNEPMSLASPALTDSLPLCHWFLWYMYAVTQLGLTLFDPMDCSPPGPSVHRIFQARILEWVAISFCKGSSWPRYQTQVSCIGRQILYHCIPWETLSVYNNQIIMFCTLN